MTTPRAVLVVCFKRVDRTVELLSRIRDSRPDILYVACDGPRPHVPGEAEACQQVQRVFDSVDWPCEVVRDFSPENMGSGPRIISALRSMSEVCNQFVVIEDDLLPEPEFFRFVYDQLDRYVDIPKIGSVSGSSFLRSAGLLRNSYYFSRYPNTLGWGVYSSTISSVDFEPDPDRVRTALGSIFPRRLEATEWARFVRLVYENKVSAWDFQFCISQFLAGKLQVIPRVRLIANNGAGPDATHVGVNDDFISRPVYARALEMRHPKLIWRNPILDALYSLGVVQPQFRLYKKYRPYGQELRKRLVDNRLMKDGSPW